MSNFMAAGMPGMMPNPMQNPMQMQQMTPEQQQYMNWQFMMFQQQ